MDPSAQAAAGKDQVREEVAQETGKSSVEMDDAVEDMMKNLKLTAAEAGRLVDDDEEELEKPMWTLAGKILSEPKVFHINTISAAPRPVWGNPKGLLFRDGGRNMFIAELDSERDQDRIWERSPWTVNKCAVVLENFHHRSRPSEMRFDKLMIWVRVIDLPYNKLNGIWGERIAKKVGEFVKLDINKDGLVSAQYLRARVYIKVKDPLMRWVGLESVKLGKTFWYSIQYEFLPYFCFSCGVLGHSDTVCPTPSERDEVGNLPWGPFLRAPNDLKKKNGPPFAEGGYDEFYTDLNKDTERTDTRDLDSGEPSDKPPFRAPLGGRGRGRNGNARGGGNCQSIGSCQWYLLVQIPKLTKERRIM
ncbi:hypothetical protein ACQ4PT_062196 [Festuca glaucescens]